MTIASGRWRGWGFVLTVVMTGCGSGAGAVPDGDVPISPKEVFLETRAALAAQGIEIDRKLWEDPQLFQRYIHTFLETADRQRSHVEAASFSERLAPKTLIDDGTDVTLVKENYCGPGSGSALPSVTDCMNNACRDHDACYSGCTGDRSSKLCSFTSATSSCDRNFFRLIEGCQGQRQEGTQQQLLSDAVALIAQVITAVPHDEACGADFSCPQTGP